MRVMLDTNIFDRMLDDPEAVSELINRRDLRLLVTPIQLVELAAIPDPARRERLLNLALTLCATIAAGVGGDRAEASGDRASRGNDRHGADRLITAAAKHGCGLLVSDDLGLLGHAMEEGLRVMDWTMFLRKIVFAQRRRA